MNMQKLVMKETHVKVLNNMKTMKIKELSQDKLLMTLLNVYVQLIRY